MGQGSTMETKWDAATLNVLLANAGHNLGNIDVASLTSSNDHAAEAVATLQTV
jgi:hypothetical protein